MTEKICALFNTLVQEDGFHETGLKEVKLHKHSGYAKSCPYLYDNYLILVLQGKKVVHLAQSCIEFNKNNYLVVPTTLPLDCETFASEQEPFLSIMVHLNQKVLFEVLDALGRMSTAVKKEKRLGVFTGEVSPALEDVIERLLLALSCEDELKVLGDALLKEVLYRVVLADKTMFLQQLFLSNSIEAKIARTIKLMHTRFDENLNVEMLSRKEEMSVSSFHKHFKDITSFSPKQYMKNLRLTKARELLMHQTCLVNEVAQHVGYESAPQFSTDYKSYFGFSPKQTPKSFSL